MRWLIGTVLALLLSLVIYVGSAVSSLNGLAEAAQSSNGQEIIARTDLPRVKRSLVDQIVRAYLERQGAKRPVCTENLNPDVVMVKPAEDRV